MPQQRWFRFSLRTMLVVVTVLCCWLAWESSIVRERRSLRSELAARGMQFTTAADYTRQYSGRPPGKVVRVSQLRRLLGDEAIQQVWYSHLSSPEDLIRLAEVLPEATVQQIPLEPCHPGCFPRGTLVETPRGPLRIETLRPGDQLIAYRQSGEQVTAAVQSVFVTSNRLWKIDTTASVLLTTDAQPLCVAQSAAKLPQIDRIQPAGELQPGDRILRYQEGQLVAAEVLAVAPTSRPAQVFNVVLQDSEIFVAGGFLARSKPPLSFASE